MDCEIYMEEQKNKYKQHITEGQNKDGRCPLLENSIYYEVIERI